jgi:hypothetical protein
MIYELDNPALFYRGGSMTTTNVSGYSFGKYVVSSEAQLVADEISPICSHCEVTTMLTLLQFCGMPFEIVVVAPNEKFSLPASMETVVTQVICAGPDEPLLVPSKDKFGNTQACLTAGSAVKVIYKTNCHPNGFAKVWTTLNP